MRIRVQSLASLSGLGIQHGHELWYRSQTRFRPHVAVAGSCSSDSTPRLGTFICRWCGLQKKKGEEKEEKNTCAMTKHQAQFSILGTQQEQINNSPALSELIFEKEEKRRNSSYTETMYIL